MGTLEGRIAVVTGGTAGVGRGVASELAHSGARVFVTGRAVQDGECDGSPITAIRCDHREDEQVAAAFERVAQEARHSGQQRLGWLRADDGRWCVHVEQTILGTAALALGCDV